MNLYLISQTENVGWDTYDSAVVCAPDRETAQNMNPSNGEWMTWESDPFNTWATAPEHVSVQFLGAADDEVPFGVVCASFNAG